MTATVQDVAETWIVSQLAANADIIAAGVATKIYSESAPPGVVGPLIIVRRMPGDGDLWALGRPLNARIWTDLEYLVEAAALTTSYRTIDALAAAIDVALWQQSGTAQGGTVYQCVRVTPFELTEGEGKQQWRRRGGIYKLQANV